MKAWALPGSEISPEERTGEGCTTLKVTVAPSTVACFKAASDLGARQKREGDSDAQNGDHDEGADDERGFFAAASRGSGGWEWRFSVR